MTCRFLTYATAFIVVNAGGVLHAQVVPPTPTTPPSALTAPQRDDRTVTATGCLKQEQDVPGLKPNVAERAGIGQDFVLTNAKLTGTGASSTTPAIPGSTGSARATQMAMYRITGLNNDKLQSLLNQQVEVTGRLESAPRPTDPAPATAAPERPVPEQIDTQPGRAEDLQQIRASSIRAISSSCTGGTS